MLEYALLFAASAVFEFAYVAWGRAVNTSTPLRIAAWGALVAALGLAGVGGALKLPLGWAVYIAGIFAGGYISAYLARNR